MSVTQRERPSDVFDVLAERAGADTAAVCEFARAYLRRLDYESADPAALAAEVLGAFELASARGRAPMAVRAFNGPVGAVLETNTPDLEFLVDSVSAELHERGLRIERVVHPIVGLERDGAGRIAAVVPAQSAAQRESIMHFDLDRRLEPEALAELEDAVRGVLDGVRVVVDDFPLMVGAVERLAETARAGAA